MSPCDNQSTPQILRLMRGSYVASMALGFPLWLSEVLGLGLIAYVAIFGGLNEDEPIEFAEPSQFEVVTVQVALAFYLCIYPHTFFAVHRRNKRLWLPFGLLAAPVAVLTGSIVISPPEGSLKELFWLVAYLSLLLIVLAVGLITALVTERRVHDAPNCAVD